MIILSATMWPGGNSKRSYELLHATIDNRTPLEDYMIGGDRYFAHVCSRPNRYLAVSGYEADVEVRGHKRSDGPAALIMTVLNTANSTDANRGTILPEGRQLARVTIEDAAGFEHRLAARANGAVTTISKKELEELREKAWKYEELCK